MADSSFCDHTILIPGPSFHVDLAPLDARHPIHYGRRLLIFRCASSAQRDAQLTAFKTGLQALVSRFPVLGGTVESLPSVVSSDGKQDWRTIVPGSSPGIELIVRDLRAALPPFEELDRAHFPPDKIPYGLLVPIPQELSNDRPFAACKMQFSAFEGGTILTFSMSHSVGDGVGNNELMRVLAEEMRLAHEHLSEGATNEKRSEAATPMGLDRSFLRNITSNVEFNIKDHPAYTLEIPPSTLSSHPFEAIPPEISILLRISPSNLTQLKSDATQPAAPSISTHDALAALMWRTVLLIRSRRSPSSKDLPASTIGNVYFPSDGCRHLGLPQSYIGNSVYQIAAKLPLSSLFSPSGLQHAASAIRSALTAVNPTIVTSLMAETKERWVDWGFMRDYSTTGVGMGTDWTSGSLYEDDWGEAFGKMVRFRYPGGEGQAGCCILPKLLDGGAEVVVAVLPDEVEVLRGEEGFGKYIVE